MLLINGICNDFALGVPFAASPMEYAIAVHGYTFHMSILIPVAMRADLSTFSIEAVTCLLAVVVPCDVSPVQLACNEVGIHDLLPILIPELLLALSATLDQRPFNNTWTVNQSDGERTRCV